MSDQEIAEAALAALRTCASALEALPSPENAALHDLLEEAWSAVEKHEQHFTPKDQL